MPGQYSKTRISGLLYCQNTLGTCRIKGPAVTGLRYMLLLSVRIAGKHHLPAYRTQHCYYLILLYTEEGTGALPQKESHAYLDPVDILEVLPEQVCVPAL